MNKIISTLLISAVVQGLVLQNASAYLDPGTGSYVFQALLAVVIGAAFTIKIYWQRLTGFFRNIFSKKQ